MDWILPPVSVLERDYPGCLKGHLIKECEHGEENAQNMPLIDTSDKELSDLILDLKFVQFHFFTIHLNLNFPSGFQTF